MHCCTELHSRNLQCLYITPDDVSAIDPLLGSTSAQFHQFSSLIPPNSLGGLRQLSVNCPSSSVQQLYPAVNSPSTVYVRCAGPGDTSVYVWRCPVPLVWSQQTGGCVDVGTSGGPEIGRRLRALPELVGVLDSGTSSGSNLVVDAGGRSSLGLQSYGTSPGLIQQLLVQSRLSQPIHSYQSTLNGQTFDCSHLSFSSSSTEL